MKIKKLLTATTVLALGLTLTGCSGKLEDFEKQRVKAVKLAEKGEIFEDDYKITMTIKFENEGKESKSNIVVKMEDEEMYMEIATDSEGTELDTIQKIWVGEDDDKYYVFMNDGTNKLYKEITERESNEFINTWIEEAGNLEDNFMEILETIKDFKDTCGKDGLTCSVKKNLFGNKVTLKAKKDTEESKDAFEITIKNGKIISTKSKAEYSEDTIMSVNMNFDYSDQEVRLPSKTGYTYSEELN